MNELTTTACITLAYIARQKTHMRGLEVEITSHVCFPIHV